MGLSPQGPSKASFDRKLAAAMLGGVFGVGLAFAAVKLFR